MGSSPAACPPSLPPTVVKQTKTEGHSMGVFFPLFFLLVKEICMLFTHISISTQTRTHTYTAQIHMPTQRAVVCKRVRGGWGILQWKTPWNFQYIKIEVRCVFSLLHSNVKCQRQINVTAQQTCLPLSPFPLPLQHSHWCVCVCVCLCCEASFGAHLMRCHDASISNWTQIAVFN